MPRLTIVIPGVNCIPSLECTLVSVLENRPSDCEILVVLNQAYDDPYELKDEVRFVQAQAGAGVAECAALGAKESRAPIVHLLASGCEVRDGWTTAALERFDDPNVAAVAPVILDSQDRKSVLAVGVSYGAGGTRRVAKAKLHSLEKGRRPSVLGPTYQASFYRKSLLAQGPFSLTSEVGDRLADVDLALSLRHAGYRTIVEPNCKVYGVKEARVGRTFREARFAERLFWRNAPLVGWVPAMVCHPFVVASECVTSILSLGVVTQLLGRAVGCLSLSRYHRHHALLAQIADSAAATQVAGQVHADPGSARPLETRRKAG